jgi:hypothetical protein
VHRTSGIAVVDFALLSPKTARFYPVEEEPPVFNRESFILTPNGEVFGV